MACSSPNRIGVNRYTSKTAFLGPKKQELHRQRCKPDPDLWVYDIPCGKCDLCLIDNRYSKALRIMLESLSYPDKTYFITLTYDNDHIENNELNHKHWAQFMKNFRRKYCEAKYCNIRDKNTLRQGNEYSTTFKKLKQVVAGEYGDTFGRRHFHGIIFNHKFTDLQHTGNYSKKGNPIYTSPSLQSVWKKGIVQVDAITFDLALYVAAYITDKSMDEPQETPDGFKKQYGRMGKGIGLNWITQYWRDVLNTGKVMLHDRDFPVPRYFLEKIKLLHPEEFKKINKKRFLTAYNKSVQATEKGDGYLRRANAKGRIFKHNKHRRKLDDKSSNGLKC